MGASEKRQASGVQDPERKSNAPAASERRTRPRDGGRFEEVRLMDFFDVVESRRSVRAYDARPVEEEKLRSILNAANQAPSAGNLQAYEIYLVRNKAVLRALATASLGQQFVAGAPLALVFCAHPARATHRYGERGRRLYAVQDATIACTYAMLAATALGLSSVWIGAFDDEGVRRAVSAPEGQIPVAVLPVGYPGEHPAPTPRRPLADLVHRID
jgi:nitroreductase